MQTKLQKKFKQVFFILGILLLSISAIQAQKSEIFIQKGKAINGYDPVAFHTESKPMKGMDSLSFQWKEASWYFSTPENRNAFAANPEKYAPQYGGYCAYGTADGHKAPTQVNTWTIVEGKLYFNYNNQVKDMWNKNRDALIVKADTVWPVVKNSE